MLTSVKTRNRDAAIFKEELWQTQLVHNMITVIKQKYSSVDCAVVTHPMFSNWSGYVNVYVLVSRSNELGRMYSGMVFDVLELG